MTISFNKRLQLKRARTYNKYSIGVRYTLDPDASGYGLNENDQFGRFVATSSNYTIVGAPYEDEVGGSDSGKAYIYSNSTGELLYTLNNPNAYSTPSNDYFGFWVAISDNYAIVGAYQEDDVGGTSSGKAYIYSTSTGALLYVLNNPNAYSTATVDYFGFSVAISDNYAIVGAYLEDDVGGTSSGVAYIYSTSTGGLLYTLTNPNAYSTTASDQFGFSVAISNNYAIVGAPLEDDAGGADSGKAYIYSTSTGGLLYTLTNPNAYGTTASDVFGYSVAISDNYAVVGAYGEDPTGATNGGAAYVYNTVDGTFRTALVNPSPNFTGAFGNSVAISGNYIVVGEPNGDNSGGGYSGQAHVYDAVTGNYVYFIPNPTSIEYDYFGNSVSISNSYIVVGAYGKDSNTGNTSGGAYIYSTSTGALLYTLNNPTPSLDQSSSFGRAVAVSPNGQYGIVGAPHEDEVLNKVDSGKAYVYNPSNGQIIYTISNPTSYSTSAGDFFGLSVGISNNYIIIGAYAEGDAGGTLSGKAYIYSTSTGSLLYVLNNPNAYSTSAGDFFGFSVAISDNYAIVGAYLEDDVGGTSSGKAYIYSTSTGGLLYTLTNPNAYSTTGNDYFGQAVAISDNYAIVGAYLEDDVGGTSSGVAYIYSTSTGGLLYTLTNPNATSTTVDDSFGLAVAISDNYAIVGAPFEDVGGTSSGSVYIFSTSTGGLLHTLTNPNAYGTVVSDQFGQAVAISNNYAIVGAPLEDDAAYLGNGKAYIFSPSTGSFIATLNDPNIRTAGLNDSFGYSVAISDTYGLVGAPGESDKANTVPGRGVAYVFGYATDWQ